MEVNQKISCVEIEKRFNEYLNRMTGGQEQLAFGVGDWLHLLRGKKILSQVIHSECFRVTANDGTNIQGKEKLNKIVKELIRINNHPLPEDFCILKEMIERKVNGSCSR